jgi:hypothetical protein
VPNNVSPAAPASDTDAWLSSCQDVEIRNACAAHGYALAAQTKRPWSKAPNAAQVVQFDERGVEILVRRGRLELCEHSAVILGQLADARQVSSIIRRRCCGRPELVATTNRSSLSRTSPHRKEARQNSITARECTATSEKSYSGG